MKKGSKLREKRIRPEKIISEREFLNPELRRTKEDLPRDMMLYVSKNPAKKVKEEFKPEVNGSTKKYLGHGKRPRWMDCPEREVIENA